MKHNYGMAVSLVCAALCTQAGQKFEIAMMDVSNETGPNPAKVGYVCIANQQDWAALRVTAPSRVTIPLGREAETFDAMPGVSCHTKVDSGACFKVIAPDGKVLWEKEGAKKGEKNFVHADVRGLDSVTLEVSGEVGILAGWSNASFIYADGKYPPNDVRNHSPQLGVLTPPERPEPRINSPVVYGVRPGHPVIFHVPVTGERPMKVKVENLKSLSFDSETHVITGSIKEPGEYLVKIVAENAKGKAERTLTFKVGDKISLTPAMGWNSWNCFSTRVTAEKVRAAADALVSSGLAEHGWAYVNIDDFWQNKPSASDKTLQGPERGEDGSINSNARFPDMKGLADYIHSKGFKAGLYSSPGPTTCGGCTGSYQHEAQDAKTYADWGYDYLKHDWCSYGSVATGTGLERAMRPYRIMGDALRAQNRDIVFSLCQYGSDNVSTWGAKVGGHSWRVTGDVFDRWTSIAGAIAKLKLVWQDAAPGEWNDPDMLCIGPMCWNAFKGSRLAPNEQYTHISMWALAAAPLMIGCDMTKLDEFTLSLLRNDEVIAIDQDPLGKAAACIVDKDSYEIWARPLADGSIAVGLFNKGLKESELVFDMVTAGMEGEWNVRDCWRQNDEVIAKGVYKAKVFGHATHLVRFMPGKGAKLTIHDIRDNALPGGAHGKSVARVEKPVGGCEGCNRRKK